MSFLRWFLKLFGLQVFTDQDVSRQEKLLDAYVHQVEELNHNLNKLSEDHEKLLKDYDIYQIIEKKDLDKRNDELNAQNDKLQKDLEDAIEFFKTVEKSLSKLVESDDCFRFKNAVAIPGSTSIATKVFTGEQENESEIVVSGRTIMDDQTTSLVHQYPSITDKYKIFLNTLIQYGVLDQITKQLLNQGALTMEIGYNEDCTSAEVYYQIRAIRPSTDLRIQFNKDDK